MANISTFELLVKPIAPLTGNPLIDAPFRRAVQGYFLTISNPNNFSSFFRIRVRTPVWDARSPDPLNAREIVNGDAATRNHIYTYDIIGGPQNNQQVYEPLRCRTTSFNGFQRHFITQNLKLPAGQTASFKLLPDLVSPAINLANPRLEIRGYIELVQLRGLVFETRPDGTTIIIFSGASPINLMFSPETRGTFLDNAYPGGTNLDFDQIAYSIPTSTGGANVLIEEGTEQFLVLCFFPFLPDLPIKIEELEGKLDFSGRFTLNDTCLRQLNKRVEAYNNEYPEANLTLSMVRDQIEKEINEFATLPPDYKAE